MPAPFPFFQAPLGSALLISKNHTLLRDGKGWGGAREGRVHMAAWLPLPEREWRLCHTCGVCSPFASSEAMPCDDLCGIEQQCLLCLLRWMSDSVVCFKLMQQLICCAELIFVSTFSICICLLYVCFLKKFTGGLFLYSGTSSLFFLISSFSLTYFLASIVFIRDFHLALYDRFFCRSL